MANDLLADFKRQHDARPPAHSPLGDADTERAAVCCALLQPELFRNHLDERHFFSDPDARRVWAAGGDLLRAGRPVTDHTLADVLEQAGVQYPAILLAHLSVPYESPASFEGYADILRRWADYRSLIGLWAQVQRLPPDGSAPDTDTMFQALQMQIERLRSDRVATDGRLQTFTAADALAPQPAIVWAVDQLLMPSSVNMLYGVAGSGKTYAACDMAVCFALGQPWAGLVTSGGPVLMVDEESGKRRLSDRLGRCLRGHLAGPDTPIHYISLAGFNLTGPVDHATLRDLVDQTGAKLVLIDALVDVAMGADENSVKDMVPVLHGLRQTADATGAAIMLIHHSNRAGGYRGSSAIAGALDAMLEFGKAPGTQSLHELKTEKQRDGEPINLRLMLRWDDGTFDVRRAPDAPRVETFSRAENYVLRVLAEGPMTTTAIMAGADTCADTTARKALYSLADRGKVKRLDAGGGGTEATYGLVPPN